MSTTIEERIDISEPLRLICDRLGLVYNNVLHIDFHPGSLTATIARLNEHGSKFIEDDEVAVDEREFKVLT